MLLMADPQVPLRIGTQREVFNGVFVDQADLYSARLAKKVHNFAVHANSMLGAGDIEVSSLIARDPWLTQSEVDHVSRKLIAHYRSWGFLEPEQELDFSREVQVMSSQGGAFHVDTFNPEWLNSLFWVYVLEASGVDLVFPNLGMRFTLKPGQSYVFDPGQVHGVVKKGSAEYDADFFGNKKLVQTYLAGHIPYEEDFFHQLGLKTGPRNLPAKHFAVVRFDAVCDKTGAISLKKSDY